MTGLGFDQTRPATRPRSTSCSLTTTSGKMTYLDEMRDTVGLSAIDWLRSGHAHPGAVRGGPRRGRQVRQGRLSSARSPATPMSRIMAARRRRARDGLVRRRADAARPGPEADRRTSTGRCRPRAGCSGRTTWSSRRGRPTSRMAESWIDFYYDPANAATIEAYVNYVCPVAGAKRGHARARRRTRQQPADLPAPRLGRSAPPVPRDDGRGGDRLERGVHQGSGPLASDAPGDQRLRRRSPRTRCSLPGPALAGRVLRLPGHPDVPGLAVDRQHQGRLRSRPGTGASTRRRSTNTGRGSPARSSTAGSPRSWPSRWASRSPTRSPSAAARTRTCCCSSSSRRSSRASCCARSPGRSSWPTTASLLGPLKDDRASCPRSSASSRRRRRSSPASPTTSCRS